MPVTLYEHNRSAYQAALSMMESTGKAAVIHPTGTGKSFLAFQLCEDHPKDIICWLSPSEHIFRTQEEKWEGAGGKKPENVRFYTYARLMTMSHEQLMAIQPGYIILDEFHRCGARMWGQGVQRLLSNYPDVPLLGLSATHIRYLDNQRDMAEELFEGSITSEMTLGEAVVRGILHPPNYVLSVFPYEKDFKGYETRIRGAKNKAVREDAGKILEALRRKLEHAKGLEEVFAKHMTDYTGKYIVFCANFKHMQEMIEKVPEWFRKVDAAPHVYAVYSGELGADKNFDEFKADHSSHLKLLFCIDMLNEGIHVEGVSGVILLRPTVSPIIYKQQIGRALSAGAGMCSVIFDIVQNIENLYSIGVLEDEVKEAAVLYGQGCGKRDFQPLFHVTDETADCLMLFRKLEETLGSTWERMYQAAEAYYKAHGDLKVPKRYKTLDGLSLGAWLDTQRRVYHGKAKGVLTQWQKERLTMIGMQWQGTRDEAWERKLQAARSYYQEHGNLLVGARETYKGVALGAWLSQLRVAKKEGGGKAGLTPERETALEEIGMVWDPRKYQWEMNYQAAENYYQTHGNLNVPAGYVTEGGIQLGAWIIRQRRIGREAPKEELEEWSREQTARLDAIGMEWAPLRENAWERAYRLAQKYREEHGSLNIPVSYVTQEGIHLGKWIRRQREAYKEVTKKWDGVSWERRAKLESIGMIWEKETSREQNASEGMNRHTLSWKQQYEEARRFYQERGHLHVPSPYPGAGGRDLGNWLKKQRAKQRAGKLKHEQAVLLEEIGMCWNRGASERK